MPQANQELDRKQKLERKVFAKFVKHISAQVKNVESRTPPEPDIYCDTEHGGVYFELTDNTSESIQQSVHAKDEATRGRARWFTPFPEQYKDKFTKTYKTDSTPCELVIYFVLHPVAALGNHFDERLQEHIGWIERERHRSAFRKVWIYDYHRDQVLACINGNT